MLSNCKRLKGFTFNNQNLSTFDTKYYNLKPLEVNPCLHNYHPHKQQSENNTHRKILKKTCHHLHKKLTYFLHVHHHHFSQLLKFFYQLNASISVNFHINFNPHTNPVSIREVRAIKIRFFVIVSTT